MSHHVLVLGASYGSLLSTKLLLAGHHVTLVCTSPTAALINREGTLVRFPVQGEPEPVEVPSPALPGMLRAAAPEAVRAADFALVVLAMQEAQYGAAGVRDLMQDIARVRVPALAIMNMPPLPFLERIPGLPVAGLHESYAHPQVWHGFEPGRMTLASPDPQAFRPPDAPKNVLQVGLPTNFKAAPFAAPADAALLRALAQDVEDARFDRGGRQIALPVKLKVHDSLFVPLAKWPMLITGNYRCITAHGPVPIARAVHDDLTRSRRIYEQVSTLCMTLGAAVEDLVPFDKYAAAAKALGKPSSAARALFEGAAYIERVDRLVLELAAWCGLRIDSLEYTVSLVEARLAVNRAQPRVA